jgi:hypothetical protein
MPSTYGRPWIDAHAPSSFRTNANAVAAREISGCPRSPSADYIAFAEQKTSPVTESSATAAREPPHRRAAPQDFTRLGTNAMSGPGVYEPGEEYVPAGIKPLVDEGSLPVAPAAGGEELWLIQIPHDADPADLDGLRFKISDEDAGAEISQFVQVPPIVVPRTHRRTGLSDNPRVRFHFAILLADRRFLPTTNVQGRNGA